MTQTGHLWAIGYDDVERAEQVRHDIVKLGEKHCLILLDTAVVVRSSDGSVMLDGEPFLGTTNIRGHSFTRLFAALALATPPRTPSAVRAWLRCAGAATSEVGIDENFVCDVESLIKLGTSALFVLDQECDLDAILQGIRGLGGTVLKTNMDLERSKLIQSTLAVVAERINHKGQ